MNERTPIWAWFVVGWLAVDLVAGFTDAPPARVLQRFAELRERHRLELDREAMNVRELRLLPGIGEKRARAIRAARDEHRRRGAAGPLDWTSVHGIGERTVERVDAWFAEREPADQASGNRSP